MTAPNASPSCCGRVSEPARQWLDRHRGGHATSVPPHNAGELCQALMALIENPKIQDRPFSGW